MAKPKTAEPQAKRIKPAAHEKPVVKERYYEARGGRKTAIARVRLYSKRTGILINDKDFREYFKAPKHQQIVIAPLETMKMTDTLGATVKVSGGGLTAQAEAVRHGLSRALVKFNDNFKKRLRRVGFLTRDSRMVERKKYGLKKAISSSLISAPSWVN